LGAVSPDGFVPTGQYADPMRGLGLERPPRWGVALLIALVVGNIALFSFLGLRSAPEDPGTARTQTAADQAPVTPQSAAPSSPSAAAPTSSPVERPVLAVYGDGYAAGNALGGRGPAGWPALVAQQVGADLALNAAPQAGYAAVGTTGQDYVDLVEASPVAAADVTVVFGSRNDGDESAGTVTANAAAVFRDIRAAAPETTILVVGPVWSGGTPPAGVQAANAALAAAADAAGVTYVDALEARWFADGQGIAADGVSPTDAGHANLAGLIAPLVSDALS
jgi:lysophospholipase L1-like esterase